MQFKILINCSLKPKMLVGAKCYRSSDIIDFHGVFGVNVLFVLDSVNNALIYIKNSLLKLEIYIGRNHLRFVTHKLH